MLCVGGIHNDERNLVFTKIFLRLMEGIAGDPSSVTQFDRQSSAFHQLNQVLKFGKLVVARAERRRELEQIRPEFS